jgi:polysaccharide pyruvyl transferase WcaK-like protein
LKKVLYIGWIGFRNLGDELLWNIFQLESKRFIDSTKVQVVPSKPGIDLNKVDEYDSIVLGGGSLLLPGYLKILKDALLKGKKVLIWGTGLDWLSESQLLHLVNNEQMHLKSTFQEHEVKIFQEVLQMASFVGVRGPLTKKALTSIVGAGNASNIEIIGDPGLLLSHNGTGQYSKKIAINWGTTYNRLYGGNELDLENKLVEVSKQLINKGYKILIYSVWDQDNMPCERLYNKIGDPANVTLDQKLYSEQGLMELLSSCLLSINFKLHANVLSLSAGVPAIPIGYRFKVYDLASLINIDKLVISPSSTSFESDILETVIHIEKNRSGIVEDYKKFQIQYKPKLVEIFKNQLFI